MTKKYFININGVQSAPMTLEQLENEYITDETMVWTEGLENWAKACDLAELKSIIKATPPAITKHHSEGICASCGEFKESKNAKCWNCHDCNNWIGIPRDLNEHEILEFVNEIKNSKIHYIPSYDKSGNIKYFKESNIKKSNTDLFAIISFVAGLGGFIILPILFIPIGYIASIVSFYRIKQDRTLGGNNLRIIGAILTTINILYVMYSMRIGFFR